MYVLASKKDEVKIQFCTSVWLYGKQGAGDFNARAENQTNTIYLYKVSQKYEKIQ